MIIGSPYANNSLQQLDGSVSVRLDSSARMVESGRSAALEKPSELIKPALEEKPSQAINAGSDISLRFRVDQKSNEVFVYVIDRASKKVVRTIPMNELARLSAGQLVRLTA